MLSTCDVEETMKSVYETDYEKRGEDGLCSSKKSN